MHLGACAHCRHFQSPYIYLARFVGRATHQWPSPRSQGPFPEHTMINHRHHLLLDGFVMYYLS